MSRFCLPRQGCWVLASLVALLSTAMAGAHGHEPPWLDTAALDRGLFVDVQHPRAIRQAGPLEIAVTVRNMAGPQDVIVESVRYIPEAGGAVEVHNRAEALPTRRAEFEHYKLLRADLVAAERGNREVVRRLIAQAGDLLRKLSSDVLRDRYRVPIEMVPDEPGTTLRLAVEIVLTEGGSQRTIRRQVEIPIQPPLPDGSDPARTWRYQVADAAWVEAGDGARTAQAGAWYAGDQHLHTTYSLDALVLDGTEETVTDYAAASELLGLDWIIITDHSNVHVTWEGTEYYTPEQFAEGTAQAADYTAQHPLVALYGQEMGAGQSGLFALPSHYLAYPFAADSTGYLPNPSSGLIFGLANCEPEQVIIDRVNEAGGIGFIAHPFDSGTLAFVEWDFDNGATGWAGLEIWSDTLGQIKATDTQAVSKWHELLNAIAPPQLGALSDRPGFPNAFPVGLGNSDAHQPGLIGATFTYARMLGVTRENVVEALRTGRCVASNGPLLFGEVNGTGVGDVALLIDGDNALDLHLATTPEFGPVGDYELTVQVNGAVRATIAPSGDPGFAATIELAGLNLGGSDRWVTVRADSSDDTFHATANPIWLQFVAAGDANADGVIGLGDFGQFADCLTGPGAERAPACDIMDFDRDRDVDLGDFGHLQAAFANP